MTGKPIMLQGTSSNVGKSVLAAALCRIFYQDGFQTAPFKAQNMALNSAVTPDGGEIGRAQAVQAEAACVKPTVEMNPVLIKPKQDMHAQIVVMGKPYADMSAKDYRSKFLPGAHGLVLECINKLKQQYEVLVIEGAGSPAEVNLKSRDIVNMKTAELADSPVLLIADIDRGGVFASLVGTLELLEPEERLRVKGFIINKFRGDIDLLKPGLDFLEQKTGIPVLGVIPYLHDHGIEEEDSVWLSEIKQLQASNKANRAGNKAKQTSENVIKIAVTQLPRISNFTDMMPFMRLPDTELRFVNKGECIGDVDVVIIPGTKNSILDLLYLKEQRYDKEIIELAAKGARIVGICGGYQMLGKELLDPTGTEADVGNQQGLGLLPISTTYSATKSTFQVEAKLMATTGFWKDVSGQTVRGYEIHMGQSKLDAGAAPLLEIKARSGQETDVVDGAYSENGKIFGTHVHGFFDNITILKAFINDLRAEKGLSPIEEQQLGVYQKEQNYNRLADAVRESLDMERLYEIIGLTKKTKGA
ncbi:cobyric acid synthase [Desulfuribacillus alkaliarsenatis]|uniref:Cobyric acid synthase n=1 Tax=Desulfuribacillus alkaliarsenatis TaxID=766136 RepID=A0A1E5G5M2_9FIRM|nr:cobyric acid synthase [Desulfuribacillus alkaliarsenatis]OEF97989.1 cobyric acid synthase CobQ [Desulfuribacillus alkaliarsenatis]